MIPLSLGIDLAASEKSPSGVCLLKGKKIELVTTLYEDAALVEFARLHQPKIIAIDAPLSLPRGRRFPDDREGPHFRECDLALRKLRIKFFPVTLGAMRKLTARGMRLRDKLSALGFEVIEVYPGGAQDVLNIPRGKHSREGLRWGLESLGITGLPPELSLHELDAVTSALIGKLYLEGNCSVLGDPEEGTIIMPRIPGHLPDQKG